MGLDTVELVLKFEREFALSISDTDAEKMGTVGDSFAYIVRKLGERGVRFIRGRFCSSARIFYELRAGLVAEFGIHRNMVRPSSEIGTLVPEGPARALWAEFAQRQSLPRAPFSFFRTRRFPSSGTTIAKLVRQASLNIPPDVVYVDGTVDPNVIWEKVREIVSEQMGVDRSEIQPHVRYIEDLNC